MKRGLGLVILSGCSLYFGSDHHAQDDSPFPEPPDGGRWSPDGASWDAEGIPDGLLPVAPSAGEFMWQGVQEHFKANGVDCHGQVTVAASDHAVCYVGADDDVHCSGSTYTQSYGTGFTALGKTGVDQIILTMTYDSQDGNSICVHERNQTIECFGANNDWGQFGDGTFDNASTWTTFGTGHAWKRFTSMSQIACAIDDANAVYCAGYGFGSTPVPVGNGSTVYVGNSGVPQIDDPTVMRAGSHSSYCLVEASGLDCIESWPNNLTGVAGHVVDGTTMNAGGTGPSPSCNLDDLGNVHCSVSLITERQFSARPNVALAGSFYTDTHCAVGNDGSLWCRSSNRQHELGSNIMVSPYYDTQVQPPGSVKVTCN